jgi:hypothetical protein
MVAGRAAAPSTADGAAEVDAKSPAAARAALAAASRHMIPNVLLSSTRRLGGRGEEERKRGERGEREGEEGGESIDRFVRERENRRGRREVTVRGSWRR